MEEEIFYFAYGMLTDPYIMPEDAEYYGKAMLNNHSLEFRFYANAIESNESMFGVLWGVDEGILAELDVTEGVPTLYKRKQVTVTNKEVGSVTAWVYYMTEETRRRLENRAPARSYLKTMAYGYDMADIPTMEIQKGLVR